MMIHPKLLRFHALIAAAGLSRRMGMPKALCLINKEPAAIFLARQCLAAKIDSVALTIPDNAISCCELVKELRHYDVKVFKNLFPSHGYAGSIESALLKLGEPCQGIVIMPIDCIVTKELIIIMINLARSYYERPLIIVPHCDQKPGHPIYVSQHLFGELQKVHRYGGLHRFIEAHARLVFRLGYFDSRILLNLNEPDKKRHEQQMEACRPAALGAAAISTNV
jgi:CTP:molybdopterin cytidylyltransferase MocA